MGIFNFWESNTASFIYLLIAEIGSIRKYMCIYPLVCNKLIIAGLVLQNQNMECDFMLLVVVTTINNAVLWLTEKTDFAL